MSQSFTEIVGITGVFTIRIDDTGTGITYIGKADPGSLESSSVWQIARIDETISGQTKILYANGENFFSHIWDDRDSLTYT